MKLKTKEILIGTVLVGLGIAVVILEIKNSRLHKEIKTLQGNLEGLNKQCDKKNSYIGKILTEIKIKRK